jgi:hypothetical protein
VCRAHNFTILLEVRLGGIVLWGNIRAGIAALGSKPSDRYRAGNHSLTVRQAVDTRSLMSVD